MPGHDDVLPSTMWEFVRAHPHPNLSAQQLFGLNVTNYAGKLWHPPSGTWIGSQNKLKQVVSIPPKLYESQQGPIYYHVLAIIKKPLQSFGLLVWADTARLINVLLGMGVVLIWFVLLRNWLPGSNGTLAASAVVLLMATNPLFIYDVSRVTNDILAILLGSLALLIYSNTYLENRSTKRLLVGTVITGVFAALAVLTKAITVVLVVAIPIAIAIRAYRSRLPVTLGVLLVGIFLGTYIVIAGWYHVDALRNWGGIVSIQENLQYKEEGSRLWAVLAKATELKWGQAREFLTVGYVKTGGWSFFRPGADIKYLFKRVLDVSLLVWVIGMFYKGTRQTLSHNLSRSWDLGLLLVANAIILLYHAASTFVSTGAILTSPTYGIFTFPVLFLLFTGWGAWDRRLVLIVAIAFVLVFSISYYETTWRLLQSFTLNDESVTSIFAYSRSHHALFRYYPLSIGFVLELVFLVLLVSQFIYGAIRENSLKIDFFGSLRNR